MFRFLVLAVGTILRQELFFPYRRGQRRKMAGKWVESKVKRYKKVRNFEFTFKRFSFTTELLEFCSRAPIWIRYDAISIDEYITLVNVDSALTHLADLFLPIAFRAIDLPMLHVLVCIGVRKNVRPNDIDEKALAIHWQNPALESILDDARRDSSLSRELLVFVLPFFQHRKTT